MSFDVLLTMVCLNLQFCNPKARLDEVIHPSIGVGNAYSQDMRYFVMFIADQF